MKQLNTQELNELKSMLCTDASLLGKLYKAKKDPYQNKNVDHSLASSYLEDGWEEYGKPLKTKTKIRKKKKHSRFFEDQIWCQLYELGFRCLNFDENFYLPYGDEKKQIDVIAVNDDCVLIFECKSSEEPKKAPSYKDIFDGLDLKINGFKKATKQLFGKDKKTKYIFATRNLRFKADGSDIERLTKADAFYYNDNTYEYINSLIQKYKGAAIYQFSSLLFRGLLICKDPIELPAVEGKMGGKTYYMFSIEPHLLLKIGFILHRTRANEAEMPTYQRLLVPSRLKGITKFIDEGGYFPNSIILNFTNKNRQKIRFEASTRGTHSASRFGTLKIPNAYAFAYIIDGQHRVYGYANTQYKETNTIPVVAFVNLKSTEQLEMFMDINQNQKAVSPTLRETLEEDLFWDADQAVQRMKALRSAIVSRLTSSTSGPLYNKISIGEDKALLSFSFFTKALGKPGLLPVARGNKFIPETTSGTFYDVNNHNHLQEMGNARDNTVKFLNIAFDFVEENFPDIYKKEQYFILSNRGIFAFIRILGSLIQFEYNNRRISSKLKPEDKFEVIQPYIVSLLTEINNLPDDDADKVLIVRGGGADTAWFMFFQSLINKVHPKFSPDDLIEWKERQDDNLQSEGRTLGIEIETYIKSTVIDKLKRLFGDNWDIEIGSIQRECQSRAREQIEKDYKEGLGRKNIEWTEMFFINDYKTIISKYWSKITEETHNDFATFEQDFALDIGMGFNSKVEKLKWLSIFNSYRNLWAHEGTKEKRLNKKEVSMLKKIKQLLITN